MLNEEMQYDNVGHLPDFVEKTRIDVNNTNISIHILLA